MRLGSSALFSLVLLTSTLARAQSPSELAPTDPWKAPRPAPPAWQGVMTTSGNDVTPATKPAPPAADEETKTRLMRLEAEVQELRKQRARSAPAEEWWKRIRVFGYVQPQLILQLFNAAASPNADANGQLPAGIGPNDTIAKSDGTTTNADFFRLRRARLGVLAEPVDFVNVMIELEPLSAPTMPSIARRLYASGIARFSRTSRLEIGLGEITVPFGFEVSQLDPDRPFIERSWMEQNLFPAEHDIGAFAYLYAGKLTVQSSVLNGVMLGEKTFAALPDLNRGKDLTFRASYDTGPFDFGANGYLGQGQRVDAQNLRFKQFPRWAINGELALHHRFSRALGRTRAFAEITYAQNLDRGVNYSFVLPDIPADVTSSVVSKNELGFFVRAEQDASKWLTFGVRYDYYTPDTSIGDNQRHTFSGVGVLHFTRWLQLDVEYDSSLDRVHPAGAAVRTKTIDTLSAVLQGRL